MEHNEDIEAEAVEDQHEAEVLRESAEEEEISVEDPVIEEPKAEKISVSESFSNTIVSSDAVGSEFEICVIETGRSKNGKIYPEDVLRQSVSLFEGAGVFAYELTRGLLDHIPEKLKEQIGGTGFGLLRNRIGALESVRFENKDGRSGLFASLKVAALWARETLKEIFKAGQGNGIGFSIDADGLGIQLDNGDYRVVQLFENPTLDLVTYPAAGGRIERLVASCSINEGEVEMPEEIKVENKVEVDLEKMKQSIRESVQKEMQAKQKEEIDKAMAAMVLRTEKRAAVVSALAESGLPEHARMRISESVEVDAIDSVSAVRETVLGLVKAEREYIKSVSPVPEVVGMGLTRESRLTVGDDELDRMQVAMDGMFVGKDLKTKDGNRINRFLSLHESYIAFTGKAPGIQVSFEDMLGHAGKYSAHKTGGNWRQRQEYNPRPGDSFRMVESIRKIKAREAASSTTWAQALGDSITRQMIAEYSHDDQQDWRSVVSNIESVKDFRTQRRVQVGGYGNLTSVLEGQNYPDLTTPGDIEETYSVTKYGGIEELTLEVIANDDMGVIRSIPKKLGRSAAETLRQSVFGVFTTNADMNDGVALFHTDHSNTGTAAFTADNLRVARVAMQSQTEAGSGYAMGRPNAPVNVLVPFELEDYARVVTGDTIGYWEPNAGGIPADANSTLQNVNLKYGMKVIPVPFWTNAKDWYLTAKPENTPLIEVGFYRGIQSPELFVQDSETVGSVFSADKVSYKIRLIYGVKSLDYRGMYYNDVA